MRSVQASRFLRFMPLTALGFFLLCFTGWASRASAEAKAGDATVSLVSPAYGDIFTSVPISVQLSFTSDKVSRDFRVTLNSVNITSLFAPVVEVPTRLKAEGDAITIALPAQLVKAGANELSVSLKSKIQSVAFTYQPPGDTIPGSSADSTRNRYKPMVTRIVNPGTTGVNPTDFSISVGDAVTGGVQTIGTPAFSSSPNNAGFQVVTLGRDSTSDSSAYSNASYPTDSSFNTSLFYIQLAVQIASHCYGPTGCLLIMQSLGRIGYTGCNSAYGAIPDLRLCAELGEIFESIGVAAPVLYANGDGENVAYSFVGNCFTTLCNGGVLVTGSFHAALNL